MNVTLQTTPAPLASAASPSLDSSVDGRSSVQGPGALFAAVMEGPAGEEPDGDPHDGGVDPQRGEHAVEWVEAHRAALPCRPSTQLPGLTGDGGPAPATTAASATGEAGAVELAAPSPAPVALGASRAPPVEPSALPPAALEQPAAAGAAPRSSAPVQTGEQPLPDGLAVALRRASAAPDAPAPAAPAPVDVTSFAPVSALRPGAPLGPAVSPGLAPPEAMAWLGREIARGTSQLLLQLDPAELGPVEIAVELRHGQVHLTIVTSTADGAAQLSQSRQQLQTQLAQYGLGLGGFALEQRPSGQQVEPARRSGASGRAKTRHPANTTNEPTRALSGGLDLIV